MTFPLFCWQSSPQDDFVPSPALSPSPSLLSSLSARRNSSSLCLFGGRFSLPDRQTSLDIPTPPLFLLRTALSWSVRPPRPLVLTNPAEPARAPKEAAPNNFRPASNCVAPHTTSTPSQRYVLNAPPATALSGSCRASRLAPRTFPFFEDNFLLCFFSRTEKNCPRCRFLSSGACSSRNHSKFLDLLLHLS